MKQVGESRNTFLLLRTNLYPKQISLCKVSWERFGQWNDGPNLISVYLQLGVFQLFELLSCQEHMANVRHCVYEQCIQNQTVVAVSLSYIRSRV